MNPVFIEGLERLRSLAGDKPLHVNSGYRCPNHNAQVKGSSPDSTHLYGIAADIRHETLHPLRLALIAEQIDIIRTGGLGLYEGRIHIDARSRRARWGEVFGKRTTFEIAARLLP